MVDQWAPDATDSVDDTTAALRAERDALREALRDAVRQLTEFHEFHDDDKHKPCHEWGAECPIGMGEFVTDGEREQLARARALLDGGR